MRTKIFRNAMFLLLAGALFASCTYTADDYVNDMTELTTKTIKNASSYTSEDWKEVAGQYKKLNEKGKKVWKELSKEQQKELKKMQKELMKEASEFDSSELKEQLNDMVDQANDFIKDVLKKD